MANFLQFRCLLREQMNATLSRTDVLRPIAWLSLILTTSTILMVVARGPEWLLILMSFFWSSVLFYMVSLIFSVFSATATLFDRRNTLFRRWL